MEFGRGILVLLVRSAPRVIYWMVLVREISAKGMAVSDGPRRPSPPSAKGRWAMREATGVSEMVW